MNHSKLIYFSVILLLTSIFSVECENPDHVAIPYVYMDLTINIDRDPEFIKLQAASNSVKIEVHPEGRASVGYDNNGIIIYHQEYRKVFYAFDATCPHDLPKSVSLNVDGSKAVCPECGSVYILPSEGIPAEGSPSKHFLKKYHTAFYASGDIHVYN